MQKLYKEHSESTARTSPEASLNLVRSIVRIQEGLDLVKPAKVLLPCVAIEFVTQEKEECVGKKEKDKDYSEVTIVRRRCDELR